MTSVFPNSVDVYSPYPPLDNWDDVMANDVASLQDSMVAVQTVLINFLSNAPGGRLTLESGVPVSATDQTAKTTLYYTLFLSDKVSLYTGTVWKNYSFTEISLSLSGFTANKNYDVFAYSNSGVVALEALAWTSDSARATALVMLNGRLTKSGDATRRYLGAIRITGTTGQCEDSVSKRFVKNYYNRVERILKVTGSTSHANPSTSVVQWNSDAAMKFEFLVDVVEEQYFVTILNDMICAATSSTAQGCVGLGINTVASLVAVSYWASAFQGRSSNNSTFAPVLGYNYVALLERGLTGCTFNTGQTSMLIKG
ncbi:MAG: hypothetical protein HY863_15820 [Chloroflexi bacterium]|nr:hypothetical protein [Chloroflexota bacterium]